MKCPNYTRGKLRLIDFIEAFGLSFTLGTVVKHVVRSNDKDRRRGLDELLKAREYLEDAIRRARKGA